MHARARREGEVEHDRVVAGRLRPSKTEAGTGAGELVLDLQRLVGNRAVAGVLGRAVTVQRTGPTPQPYKPDEPLKGDELGRTQEVPGGRKPEFKIKTEHKEGGGLSGRVEKTDKGSVNIETNYVAAGLHDQPPAENGTKRQLLVTEKVAQVVKEGEQEHSDDIWWAHELVEGEAARAVNVLAGQAAHDAPNITALHRSWRAALHDEISPKLRIAADASDPAKGGSVTGPWNEALAVLGGKTKERDFNHWHTMRSRAATPEERKAHGIGIDTYLMVTEVSGEIGKHPSDKLIKSAFDALPDHP